MLEIKCEMNLMLCYENEAETQQQHLHSCHNMPGRVETSLEQLASLEKERRVTFEVPQ